VHRLLIVLSLAVVACKDPSSGVSSSEQAYVEKEVAKLEKAIAARSTTEMTIGCTTTTTSLKRLTGPLAQKIEKLCYVDVPKILLELAIADVKKQLPSNPPELGDLACMQLFAPDAVKTVDRHPTGDPEITKLVAEFTTLCPKQVAKVRLQSKAP
jgi:hypothetical protein